MFTDTSKKWLLIGGGLAIVALLAVVGVFRAYLGTRAFPLPDLTETIIGGRLKGARITEGTHQLEFQAKTNDGKTVGHRVTFQAGGADGRRQVDLMMSVVSKSPVKPVARNIVTFGGTVRNVGTAAPPSTGRGSGSLATLRIDTGNDGTWDVTKHIDVPSLTPAAQTSPCTTLTCHAATWPNAWRAVAGRHKMRLCADNGIDYNAANNCLEEVFEVFNTAPSSPPQAFVNDADCDGPITIAGPNVNANGSVGSGKTFTATVKMKNTGTNPWTNTDSTPHKLGSQSPQGNKIWGRGRVVLPSSPIKRNETATFTFAVTAPNKAGTHPFAWGMLEELVEWFGETCEKSIVVRPTPRPDLSLSAVTRLPAAALGGSVMSFTGTVKNVGTAPAAPSQARLRIDANSNGSWDLTRTLPTKALDVNASETMSWPTIWTATVGRHTLEICANSEADQNSSNDCATQVFDVIAGVNAAACDGPITIAGSNVQADGSVSRGKTFTATVKVKNTGTKPWTNTGATPHKLGSENPRDNKIWGRGRVPLPNSPINRNETATFTFEVTAPATPETYRFAWKMLVEQVEWFGPTCLRPIVVR